MVCTHAADQDPVRVHDGVEAVGDGQHSAVHELLPQSILDDAVGSGDTHQWHNMRTGRRERERGKERALT